MVGREGRGERWRSGLGRFDTTSRFVVSLFNLIEKKTSHPKVASACMIPHLIPRIFKFVSKKGGRSKADVILLVSPSFENMSLKTIRASGIQKRIEHGAILATMSKTNYWRVGDFYPETEKKKNVFS